MNVTQKPFSTRPHSTSAATLAPHSLLLWRCLLSSGICSECKLLLIRNFVLSLPSLLANHLVPECPLVGIRKCWVNKQSFQKKKNAWEVFEWPQWMNLRTLGFSSGHYFTVAEFEPCIRALCWQHEVCLGFSLCPSPALALLVSLHKQTEKKKTYQKPISGFFFKNNW